MRIFLTGATGHIGSAVIGELLSADHEVVGLARTDDGEAQLLAAGASVKRGAIQDTAVLASTAAESDGVIHLAYMHRPPAGADPAAADELAIKAIGDGLAGSGKPFVGTSGTLVHTMPNSTEADLGDPDSVAGGRVRAENAVIALNDRQVRASVVRLPPTVHSRLDTHGFLPTLIGIARSNGVSGYVGAGVNRWPAVHTLDAAVLFRLALEWDGSGARWHGAADEGVPFREIAEAIGHQLGVPTASINAADAHEHFGWLGSIVAVDNPVSTAVTRRILRWIPSNPGLLDDLRDGHYFA